MMTLSGNARASFAGWCTMIAVCEETWVRAHDYRAELSAVYEEYRQRVFGWSLRYGSGRVAWAEDLTHDVFIKLLGKLPELDERHDLGAWLYRVTANMAFNRLRDDRSGLARVKRLLLVARHQTADLSERVEQRQEAQAALDAVARLPAQQQVVLTMKVLDGKSQREIAKTLSLSEGYVSKLLARARAAIRAAGWEVGDD